MCLLAGLHLSISESAAMDTLAETLPAWLDEADPLLAGAPAADWDRPADLGRAAPPAPIGERGAGLPAD